MTIQVGDRIPTVTLKQLGAEGMQDLRTDDFFKGRTVVLFGVPGAFTPGCSKKHLPGYVDKADAIKGKGVDEIACMAVNDPFVMEAWAEQQGAKGKVTMLPDGNAELTKAMGLETDASPGGMGIRCRRFSAVVEDGVVKELNFESKPRQIEASAAEACLAQL